MQPPPFIRYRSVRYNSAQTEGSPYISFIAHGDRHWSPPLPFDRNLERVYGGLRKDIFVEILFGSINSSPNAYVPLPATALPAWRLWRRANASRVPCVNGAQIPCNNH